MTFKPAVWYPIAGVLSVANLVAVGFAAGPGEALHATTHAVLALAFGLWANRLRQSRGVGELRAGSGSEFQARLEGVEADVSELRQELSETQERLDFAERLLAQGPETRRVDPPR
jgi:hypothetical protein